MALAVSNVTMRYGARVLFENVSAQFSGGNRYGLIGANGSGKSTLLHILAGELEATAGCVARDSQERIGVLRQDQYAYEDQVVLTVVMQGFAELCAVAREKEAIYCNPEATDADYIRAGELESRFGELGGYSAEARAAELLSGVGLTEDLHPQLMSTIPPGLKFRVLLAQALFAEPDILLLDEPTNHLDIRTICWLENVLNHSDATMILISHDRHFLNSVCTHMVDLDYGTLRIYPGTYDEYREAALIARQRLLSSQVKSKEKIAHLQDFVQRFSANKSKSRQATSRLKQIEKIKIETVKPSSRQHPFLKLEEGKKLYRHVLHGKHLSKAYNKTLFANCTVSVNAGEKVALLGTNGVGKTTLVKMFVGLLAADAGQVTWAENVKIGYYPQDTREVFSQDCSILDWLLLFKDPTEDVQSVRNVLGRLLFSGDEAHKSVQVLSGGERGRLIFGRLILEKPNVLILDEPTNHMDMETIESLNMALDAYTGTIIFVSHDRQFVSSVATRIWEMKEQRIIDYTGTYEEYLLSQGLA